MSAVYYDETDGKYFVTSLSAKAVFIIDRSGGGISTITTIDGKPLFGLYKYLQRPAKQYLAAYRNKCIPV